VKTITELLKSVVLQEQDGCYSWSRDCLPARGTCVHTRSCVLNLCII